MSRQHVAANALCAAEHMPVELFYPDVGDRSAAAEAKTVCARCPVRIECATEYMGEEHGVFGGLTAHDRQRLRRHGWRPGDPLPEPSMRGYCRYCRDEFADIDKHLRHRHDDETGAVA